MPGSSLLETFSPLYDVWVPPHGASLYTVGLVMTIYNRPAYLKRTLDSLTRSDLADTVIMLVDDAGDDPDVVQLIQDYRHPQAPVILARRVAFDTRYPRPLSALQNLLFGWSLLAEQYQTSYLANLDADMIVKPDWMQRLVATHRLIAKREERFILTGFNTLDHPVLKVYPSYYLKKSFGAACLFFDRQTLAEIINFSQSLTIDPHGWAWDWRLIEWLTQHDFRLMATRPSVSQHIGQTGINSSPTYYDWALDYILPYYPLAVVAWPFVRRLHRWLAHARLMVYGSREWRRP